MGKNDFDIDFDFEEEYGFDPKSFLGTEEYDDKIDLNAFSDEELGLTSQEVSENADDAAAAETDDFDLNEDLDIDDFLNMGSQEEKHQEEDPEDWAEDDEADDEEPEFTDDEDSDEDAYEEEYEDEEFEDDADLPEEEEPEEIAMNEEEMDYIEEEELTEEVFEDEVLPEEAQEETFQFDEEESEDDEEESPKKKRQPRPKKERKPIQLPKITLPKIKTPNIFTKFYDLYFAPVLTKSWQQEPQQDPNNPRRRRRKTRAQIFKEVYLPPIVVCLCMILVMSFVIGSLSNAIEQRRIDKEAAQSQLDASISAAAQAEQATQRVLAEAARLAQGYDYDAAIQAIESLGDLTQYPDEVSAKRAEYVTARDSLVEYQDPTYIPNLSFHVLVNDMVRAKADATYGGNYNRNFVTTEEFSKILTDLYSNGYVLVDFDSFIDVTTDLNGNEQFHRKSMYLPADKKPVMITETMVNYFAYMIDPDKDGVPDSKGAGFASKLIVDSYGDIKAEYVDSNGQTLVGNYDLVPILEDFIEAHPDFSYRGARAILAVTGDEGVFGYRINSSVVATKGNDYYDKEVAGAKQIVQALQNKGYTIACYTYENKNYANMNANNITADLQAWNQQITSVIGQVNTFVFAKNGNLSNYSSSSFDVMYDAGFRYYISNGETPMTEVNTTYIRQNRLLVTGETMAHFSSRFTGMFDCSAILDVNARGNVPTG
ncbi:MAG: hypothetical protein IJB59_08100 [Oscillospiraceae bacterium]|nr:hypothetical protein [Oscillospiraceae bacterium]